MGSPETQSSDPVSRLGPPRDLVRSCAIVRVKIACGNIFPWWCAVWCAVVLVPIRKEVSQ